MTLLCVLLAIFVLVSIIAIVKKPESVYRKEPEQQNPFEGK